MDDIHTQYFQKSKVFLYPALKLPSKSSIVPNDTFLSWENNYSVQDNVLLCTFYVRKDPEFELYENKHLINNDKFIRVHAISPDINLYVFDLKDHIVSYEHFLNGAYSKMDLDYKKHLVKYYEEGTKMWDYLLSYLYPHNYYEAYSEILMMDVSTLKDVGELCDKPNLTKENFVFSEKSPKIVKLIN